MRISITIFQEAPFSNCMRRYATGSPFAIAELVEAEQRVIAGAAEVTVVGRAFLAAEKLREVHGITLARETLRL